MAPKLIPDVYAVETTKIPDVQYTTGTTTTTFAAGQLTGANMAVYLNTGATPGTITTRTAAQMFNDFPGATTGYAYIIRIVNAQVTGTLTVGAGTGVTLSAVNSGLTTVAVSTFRDYVFTFTSPTAATMQSICAGDWT